MSNSQNPETGIGVKKPNAVEYISRTEWEYRVKALSRSKNDIVWWAENFFHIVTLDKGLVKIKLYDRQKDLLECIAKNNRVVTLASRQTGKTTTYTVFCMWYATLFPDKKIMICANKLQTSIEIMNRLRKAYEQLPFWIKPGILTYNKGEIKFANNSSIMAFSTSSSAARGQSGNVIIIDEMAFIPKNIIDEFFASVMPVISSSKNSKAIIVSTPNGASGLYYDIWQQANSKDVVGNKEGWVPFRINWWETGGIRDEQWKQQQIATVGLEKWKQEYECDFLTSATKKLIPDDITEKYKMALTEMKLKGILDGKKLKIFSQDESKIYEFTMWHEFQPQHAYLATGDIAEGVGGDSSILHIWDITNTGNITLCAKYESNTVTVIEFSYIIRKILSLYNDPYFIAERNGCSGGTLDALRYTYQYPRLVREGKNNEIGVFSHVTVKGKACLHAKELLMTAGFNFTIYDVDMIDEWSTFVKKETKGVHLVYHALPPAHDDNIMSFIWLCYMLQNDILQRYFNIYEQFRSPLGDVYPKTIMPLDVATASELDKIANDPIYRDFMLFKKQIQEQNITALAIEEKSYDNSLYTQYGYDQYFGDFNFSGSTTQNMSSQSAQRWQPFYVNTSSGFNYSY